MRGFCNVGERAKRVLVSPRYYGVCATVKFPLVIQIIR